MQIIPPTSRFMGFESVSSIEDNIRCGVRYMKYLDQFVTGQRTSRERWVAALACYNSGPGHYRDIIRRSKRRYKSIRWKYVKRVYRKRFKKARGRKDPETLIYVRRSVRTWKRLIRDRLILPPAKKKLAPRIARSKRKAPRPSQASD